ncbi:MAG TPA: patatin-like phospholipase family protein, partial [Polyangiaceae bacterium]|nr:patatin-like phospholipase family protein [Polyangiaceae bacterium]
LTGVSAGAINAAYLANSPATLGEAAHGLSKLWAGLVTHRVVSDAPLKVFGNVLRWSSQLLAGGRHALPDVRGLLDTAPLRSYLGRTLSEAGGGLTGVERKLASGRLSAFAVTTTDYASGHAITNVQRSPAREPLSWRRPWRLGVSGRVGLDHVMASAAIPVLFPAVHLNGSWHGDGSVRDTAPLSPALHLGADRILVISTVRGSNTCEPGEMYLNGYPSLARVVGVTLNSRLYGNTDNDAAQLRRLTELARACPAARAAGLRPVELLVMRPRDDLGEIAGQYEDQLPRTVRYLTRGLGTKQPHSADLLSTLLFESAYTRRLIECGRKDAENRLDELLAFVGAPQSAALTSSS